MGVYYAYEQDEEYLAHYGILGMKWGVRRYQNKDGTLTDEGLKRYRDSDRKATTKFIQRDLNALERKQVKALGRNYVAYQKAADAQEMVRRREKRGKDTSKQKSRLDKRVSELNASSAEAKRLESEIWKRLGQASGWGYSVDAIPNLYYTIAGRNALEAFLGMGSMVPGYRYKVTDANADNPYIKYLYDE